MPHFEHDDVEEEQRHFASVIATFNQYASYSLSANNRRRKDIYKLPRGDQELLTAIGYKTKLHEVDEAILANAEFLKQIVANPEIFGHDLAPEDEGGAYEEQQQDTQDPRTPHRHDDAGHTHTHDHGGHSHSHAAPGGHAARHPSGKYRPTEGDMEKLRSTLKQFVRDWSAEGKAERDVCYEPMKQALLAHFADVPVEDRGKLRVLVPGAGLCRLAWDVANLGFACQGNEFSHYMLLASFFILNRTMEENEHTIYPYVHSFSNIPNGDALLRPISFPDVSPASLPPDSNFSLVAGDFEEIYGPDQYEEDEPQAGQWDAIMTCFFIDTAKNIVNYLRIIHRKLAPGGVWINIGPLLWHWENNSSGDTSIELSLEELKALARKIGFEISNERTIDTTYTNNAHSMLGYVYHAAFFTATKKA
ncbi:N2227 domain-containing protein [Phanerochaete sordida]|uniref:carnosine N-methyltransferase n=1 Tax=Phanerochaete sordida TaxID=48140 RepID=A0A9P3G1U9_9APHY|nr:N2227 domain-containing protein [Phanerochaete sordida]